MIRCLNFKTLFLHDAQNQILSRFFLDIFLNILFKMRMEAHVGLLVFDATYRVRICCICRIERDRIAIMG
jgi:hypothetical protein